MKPTMVFLINSVAIETGGLTKAALREASAFAEMGYDTYIATFSFNPHYPLVIKKLQLLNKVHKDVKFLNTYEFLGGNTEPLIPSLSTTKFNISEYAKDLDYKKREGHNAYRLYKKGEYVKYVSLNANNSLNFIDYKNENGITIRRENFDNYGNLRKLIHMDIDYNKPKEILFFNNKGEHFLTQWNDPSIHKEKKLALYKDGKEIRIYESDDDDFNPITPFKVDCLNQMIDYLNNDKIVVVSDTRSTDEILIKLNNPKTAKIWRLHSNHVGKPYTYDAEITSKVKYGFENIDKFDVAVLLTEKQKKDVEKRIGNISNLKVVPNYHESAKSSFLKTLFKKNPKKDTKLAVIISRLSTLKRIDHSIKAFAKVVEKIHDARLEIWGSGTEVDKLKKLVEELGLQNNVSLKGFTRNPDEIYKRALFSTLTSKSEGFPLAILESMDNKVPVIAYDINYGPSDMIQNNLNGLLIENASIEELANKMIYMFENPEIAIKMGVEAKKSIDTYFNKEIFKKKWIETVDMALKSKFGESASK